MSCTLGADYWDPAKFWLIKRCPWLDTIKRGLRLRGIRHGDRLFVYIARNTYQPILGYWVREVPGGCVKAFVALRTLAGPLPSCDYVAARIRPAREQAKAGLNALHEEAYEARKAEEKQDDAKTEWLKFIKKRDPQLARLVAMGKIPVSFDRNEDTVEHLMRAAANAKKKPMIVVQ